MRRGFLDAMTVGQLLDTLAIRLLDDEVSRRRAVMHLTVSDRSDGAAWTVELSNRALSSLPGHHGRCDVAITMPFAALVALAANELSVATLLDAEGVSIKGAVDAVDDIFGHLDAFESGFGVVEP